MESHTFEQYTKHFIWSRKCFKIYIFYIKENIWWKKNINWKIHLHSRPMRSSLIMWI